MADRLMILPSRVFERMRLVSIPEDFEEHEAFRHVTGIIADVEESNPDFSADELSDALEDHGFVPVTFVLGPELD